MPAEPPVFRFANLARVPGVAHAISTRHGGVSSGRCATLNTSYSVGDEPSHVDENLERLAGTVGARRTDLFSAYQVHSNTAVYVDADTPRTPRCDVLFTTSPVRALALRHADCTPILIADPVKHAVAVAHAGWRGTAMHATRAAVQALCQHAGSNPRDLLAGVGPAIGPCCYRVGQDVVDAFADRPWAIVQPDDGGQVTLDLWEANRRDLVDAGVPADQVEMAGICTQCHADDFFSHRANGGQPAGRFAAVIRLLP